MDGKDTEADIAHFASCKANAINLFAVQSFGNTSERSEEMLLVETRIKRKLSGFSRKSPEKPSYKFHSIGSLLADLNKDCALKSLS